MNRYPDRRYYQRIAAASGYPVNPLERVFRLASLLAEIVGTLPDELLLRGGTALNLLHLDAPRLSVDLDLDYIGAAESRAARRRRPQLLAELESLATRAGYDVERSQQSYAMSHLILRFTNAAGTHDALKLDVNFLDRVPVMEPVHLSLRHPFGDDLTVGRTATFTLVELAASKVVALARRGLARDLYDVAHLAHAHGLNLDTVSTVLVVRGAAYPPPSPDRYSVQAGAAVRVVDWRAQVVAFVRRDQSADLVTAQREAQELLRRVLRFEPSHLQFLRALEAGTLDAGALGVPGIVARIESNPALLWRVQRGTAGLEER